jgi:polar amino acid transport system substrate-binding protein
VTNPNEEEKLKSLRLLVVVVTASLAFAGCSSAGATASVAPPSSGPTAAAAQSAPPSAAPTTAPTVRVGIAPANPPFEAADPNDPTKVTGFDIDVLDNSLSHEGIKYTLVPAEFAGLIPALQAGQIDMIMSDLWVNADRAKVVDFIGYASAAYGLIVKSGNPLGIASLDGLCGHRASVILGTLGQQVLEDQSKKCTDGGKAAITIGNYPQLASGLATIDNGRVDAILEDAVTAQTATTAHPDKYAVGFVTDPTTIVAAAVKKGNATLAQQIYDGFTWYQANGYDASMAKWGLPIQLKYPAKVITTYP